MDGEEKSTTSLFPTKSDHLYVSIDANSPVMY